MEKNLSCSWLAPDTRPRKGSVDTRLHRGCVLGEGSTTEPHHCHRSSPLRLMQGRCGRSCGPGLASCHLVSPSSVCTAATACQRWTVSFSAPSNSCKTARDQTHAALPATADPTSPAMIGCCSKADLRDETKQSPSALQQLWAWLFLEAITPYVPPPTS